MLLNKLEISNAMKKLRAKRLHIQKSFFGPPKKFQELEKALCEIYEVKESESECK